jgi:putative sugar O-methyltransferase
MEKEISDLWKYDSSIINSAVRQDFDNFKSNAANFKIALFNPRTNGYKYLRTLIYLLCRILTTENRERLRKIKNRDCGNPISVKYDGENICLDYLQAVYELEFMEKHFDFKKRNILEIGAGYGRTCHAVLSNHDVQSYDIIDLDCCLKLSRRYLEEVLPERHYKKINFINFKDISQNALSDYDLFINIDSMSEMLEETVHDYLGFIDTHGQYFFVKNPVGKYALANAVDDEPDADAVAFALSAGVLREVVDIWNHESVTLASQKFIRAYRPGKDWSCLAHSESIPWSYHWQAIYNRR